MGDTLQGAAIPYEELAQDLFPESVKGGQKFVPFLGAGVSISARSFAKASADKPKTPDPAAVDRAVSQFDLGTRGKNLIELAIKLAYLIDFAEQQTPSETAEQFLQRLKNDDYPPSAGELAQLFSQRAHYTTFMRISQGLRTLFPDQAPPVSEDEQLQMLKLLARVTRIANPPEPLTSIASYYEKLRGRQRVWELLRDVISKKRTPTPTHRLLAKAARHHLTLPRANDYLIITTNYDVLMETALDELKVPYIVLTTKRGDPKVLIRCSETVEDREGLKERYSNKVYPSDFTLSKSQSLVVIHKIHGCLAEDLEFKDEGLVISDNDYVDYVSQMSKAGLIPVHVSDLMREKPLWFLGYSLSDWNVRSIYETVKKKSNPDGKDIRDYSVMYSVGDFEKLFFDKNNIQIILASLNEFVAEIQKLIPSWVASQAA